MACSVTASQPFPRCEPGCPGRDGEHPVEQHHALLRPGVRSPFDGAAVAEVVGVLAVDVGQALGIGRTSGATENDRPTACPGVG